MAGRTYAPNVNGGGCSETVISLLAEGVERQRI